MYKLFGFVLDGVKHALPVGCVQRAVRAVAITPAAKAPVELLGLINLQGAILPVLNLRAILQLPARVLMISDYMIIFQNQKRQYAVVVDEVLGILELDSIAHTVIDQQQGLVFIHDPDHLHCDWEA